MKTAMELSMNKPLSMMMMVTDIVSPPCVGSIDVLQPDADTKNDCNDGNDQFIWVLQNLRMDLMRIVMESLMKERSSMMMMAMDIVNLLLALLPSRP